MLIGGALLWAGPALGDSAIQSLQVMVEDAASPWSRPDGTGYANEVVIAAFREVDVTVTLRVVPYARCKRAVLEGATPACFSMTWLPEFAGRVELDAEPLIVLNADVFESVGHPLPRPPDGHCSVPRGSVVGTVLGYEYPPEVASLGGSGVVFEPANSDYLNLKRLASGRLVAAIVITNDLEPRDQKAKDAGVQHQVRWAFRCGHETGTVGFSLAHPAGPAAKRLYAEGYRRIKARGELQRITRRWTELLAQERGASGQSRGAGASVPGGGTP